MGAWRKSLTDRAGPGPAGAGWAPAPANCGAARAINGPGTSRGRVSGARARVWRVGGAALVAIWLAGAAATAKPPEIAGSGPGASPPGPTPELPVDAGAAELCHLIESSATAHGLPPEFFARLIWKESRFDVRAVSPKGAQGVAQFMPTTARLRGLGDPFDPVQAVPASAAYLAELRERFGNLGLAAAAYNAGEDRVARYLGGAAGLPGETLDYVLSITFRPAAWFREPGREVEPRPLDPARPFRAACGALPVMKTRAVLFEGAPWKPWGVQVAGHVRRAVAMGQFARVQARHARIIGDRAPMVVQARVGTGARRIWSVRLGADSRSEAERLCARLRVAGGACVVRRN